MPASLHVAAPTARRQLRRTRLLQTGLLVALLLVAGLAVALPFAIAGQHRAAAIARHGVPSIVDSVAVSTQKEVGGGRGSDDCDLVSVSVSYQVAGAEQRATLHDTSVASDSSCPPVQAAAERRYRVGTALLVDSADPTSVVAAADAQADSSYRVVAGVAAAIAAALALAVACGLGLRRRRPPQTVSTSIPPSA